MLKSVNAWLFQQIPPVVLLALAILGWVGFLVVTPQKLTDLQAQQNSFIAVSRLQDSLLGVRLATLELVTTNLVKRACWQTTAEMRLWLECDKLLGNQVPGRRP